MSHRGAYPASSIFGGAAGQPLGLAGARKGTAQQRLGAGVSKVATALGDPGNVVRPVYAPGGAAVRVPPAVAAQTACGCPGGAAAHRRTTAGSRRPVDPTEALPLPPRVG